MKDSIFVGDSYLLAPDGIKIDEKIASFNPPKSEEDYIGLLSAIKEQGQIDPIYMRAGLAIDGRHRIKVAKQLGIQVKAVDVDPNMSDENAILISNNNTFTARNMSSTQKAMQVNTMVKQFGFTQTKAMARVGLKNRNDVSAAGFIYDNKEYRDLYWDNLYNNKDIEIENEGKIVYRGRSLRKIKESLLAIESIEKDVTEKIDIDEIVDYNKFLKCNASINEFWNRYGYNPSITVEDKIRICELLNNAYKAQ